MKLRIRKRPKKNATCRRIQVSWLVRSLGRRQLVGAEVGVYRGHLSEALLSRFPNLRLRLVDCWASCPIPRSDGFTAKEQEQHFEETIARVRPYSERVLIHPLDSVAAAMRITTEIGLESLDFVFIDADHRYEAVWKDLRAWWPLVKRGGILSGHDYASRVHCGVKLAVNEFCASKSLAVHVGHGRVWWVRKDHCGDRNRTEQTCKASSTS